LFFLSLSFSFDFDILAANACSKTRKSWVDESFQQICPKLAIRFAAGDQPILAGK